MIGFARVAVSMAALAVLTACGAQVSEQKPATSPVPRAPDTPLASPPAEGATVDIVIEDGTITPTGDRLEAEIGESITLRVDSDVRDEIHVHSDPEHEFEILPGPDQSFTFAVDVPGTVAVESHELDRTIVQLLVR